MPCEKDCPSHIKLVGKLEKAITESGSPFVPESFEQKAIDYCAGCIYDGKVGTSYRKTH